jgi:hypothetical protein
MVVLCGTQGQPTSRAALFSVAIMCVWVPLAPSSSGFTIGQIGEIVGDAQRPPDQTRGRAAVRQLRDPFPRRPALEVHLLGGYPGATIASGPGRSRGCRARCQDIRPRRAARIEQSIPKLKEPRPRVFTIG